MNKVSKNCCVKLPVDLHRVAKLEAYRRGLTLQDFVIELLQKEILEIRRSMPKIEIQKIEE